MQRNVSRLVVVLVLALIWARPASASTIGIFLADSAASSAQVSAVVTAAGHTPVALAGLSAADLASVQVAWILNGSNSGYNATILSSVASLASFVAAGGVLSLHDRWVDTADTVLPGAAGVDFVRSFADDDNIDIVTNGTLVTSGPAGVIGNTSLDGGTSSSHGYATLASLPVGAVPIFSRTDPTHIVDFLYPFGLGAVYYSTIPLDYYLAGSGPAAVQSAMATIYGPNVASFQASVGAARGVPDGGSTSVMWILGMCLLVGLARFRTA